MSHCAPFRPYPLPVSCPLFETIDHWMMWTRVEHIAGQVRRATFHRRRRITSIDVNHRSAQSITSDRLQATVSRPVGTHLLTIVITE